MDGDTSCGGRIVQEENPYNDKPLAQVNREDYWTRCEASGGDSSHIIHRGDANRLLWRNCIKILN